MNLAALPELLLSWFKNQGAAPLQGEAGKDAAKSGATFQPGAQYDGKVLDVLGNGRHLVQVAGQKLDMNLPGNTRAGDTVRLTFINSGPRPTFLLNQTTAAAAPQQVQLSNTAQQVNALVRFAQSAPIQASAPLLAASPPLTGTPAAGRPAVAPAPTTRTASSTATAPSAGAKAQSAQVAGTTVATVVNAAGKPFIPSAPAATPSASAPVAAPTPAPATTAAPASAGAGAAPAAATSSAMNTATTAATPTTSANTTVTASPGAAQAAASRPIVGNLAMLQGNTATAPAASPVPTSLPGHTSGLLGQAVDGLRAAIPSGTTLKPNALAELPTPSRHLLPIRLSQTLSESGLFYEAHLARWSRGQLSFDAILREPQAQLARAGLAQVQVADLAMPEPAAHLAGRQLGMLEGLPFLWQGLAWPGQWMQWLVQEHPGGGEGEGASGEETPHWDTELRLTMPRMGQVTAHLSLSGDRVGIRLMAPEAATREAMRAALPQLVEGLANAGLEATGLSVETQAATHASA